MRVGPFPVSIPTAGVAPPWPSTLGPRQLAFAGPIDGGGKGRRKSDFKIGDVMVHPHHGVVEVLGIVVQSAGGTPQRYYSLRMREKGERILVPVSPAGGLPLRPLMAEAEARKVLQILGTRSEGPVVTGPWSRIFPSLRETALTGQPANLARVARNLRDRKIAKQPLGENPSFSEIKLFEKVLNMLVAEIAIVLKKTEEEVRADIETALSQ